MEGKIDYFSSLSPGQFKKGKPTQGRFPYLSTQRATHLKSSFLSGWHSFSLGF